MNRDEILAKSRHEKEDEGMREAENRGRKVGFTAFSLVFLFIYLFNFINGSPNYAPVALFFIYLAAEAYPKYRFTKRTVFLITVVAGTMASLSSIMNLVITTLR